MAISFKTISSCISMLSKQYNMDIQNGLIGSWNRNPISYITSMNSMFHKNPTTLSKIKCRLSFYGRTK